jgi:hypothetical protein
MMAALDAADPVRVVNRLLVYTSFACCMLVIVSFSMFARDQLAGASTHQQNELAAGPASTATSGTAAGHGHHQPRRFIDAAAKALTAPFASIISTHSEWVLHIFPAICALLVYGLGLGFLARFSRGLG